MVRDAKWCQPAPTGATVEGIRLMRASVSPRVKVRAAHGVRTLDALLDVMAAGAERCGATATPRPGSSCVTAQAISNWRSPTNGLGSGAIDGDGARARRYA
jgi:hypothetical protein